MCDLISDVSYCSLEVFVRHTRWPKK